MRREEKGGRRGEKGGEVGEKWGRRGEKGGEKGGRRGEKGGGQDFVRKGIVRKFSHVCEDSHVFLTFSHVCLFGGA